jgi:hypothetical protein
MRGSTITNTDATSTDATITTTAASVAYSRDVDNISPEYIKHKLGFSSEGKHHASITNVLPRDL